jgi:predicted ATPase
MEKIGSIKIENFRAIKNFEITSKSINIFVGPNNCGKSSVLEGLSLNLSGNNGFNDAINNNIWNNLVRNKKYDPNFLINKNSNQAKIACNYLNGKKYSILIDIYDEGFPENEIGLKIRKYFQEKIEKYFQKGSVIAEIQESYLLNTKKGIPIQKQKTLFDSQSNQDDFEYQHLLENDEIIKETIQKFLLDTKNSIFLDIFKQKKIVFCGYIDNELDYISVVLYNIQYSPYIAERYRYSSDFIIRRFYADELLYRSPLSKMRVIKIIETSNNWKNVIANLIQENYPTDLNNLHDLAISNNKIKRIIENLSNRVTYFQDIRKTDEGLQIFLNNQNNPLPISSMGDGFKSLLRLSFMNGLLDNGVIILEEPEVSLHPGFLFVLCEAILINLKELQFFISTHSIDFIRIILQIAEWNNLLDEIQIIRMHPQSDGQEIDIEVIEGIEAKDEIEEIGRDLRGI